MAKAKKIKWDDGAGPAENARQHLPRIAAAYFAKVRKVLADDPAPAQMHPLRLASKRLRYSLELFRSCYAAGLEERIDELKEIQDLLGDCNDAVAALPRAEKALRFQPTERDRVREHLEDRAKKKAAAFRKQWTESFDAAGREHWWTGYLARSARAPAKGGVVKAGAVKAGAVKAK